MVVTQIIIDWTHLFVFALAIGFLLHEVGLISLGHAGMVLVGAYGCGFLLTQQLSVPMTFAGALVLSAVLAGVTLAVREDVFAVVSLAFAMIVHRTILGSVSMTGGALGYGPIPRSEFLGSDLGAITVGLGMSVVAIAMYCTVCRLPIGVSLGGIRDCEIAVQSLGVHTRWLVFVVVMITAAIAASVGILQALYYGLATPRMGMLDVTLQGLAAAVLAKPVWKQGRPEVTVLGLATASALLVALPPLLRTVITGDVTEAVARQALFGLALYLLVHPSWRRMNRPVENRE